jgi:hypothetical protein
MYKHSSTPLQPVPPVPTWSDLSLVHYLRLVCIGDSTFFHVLFSAYTVLGVTTGKSLGRSCRAAGGDSNSTL